MLNLNFICIYIRGILAQRCIRLKFKCHSRHTQNIRTMNTPDKLKRNPFFHEVKLTWRQCIVTCVCGIILVPLRLTMIFLMFCTMWMPYCLALKVSGTASMSKTSPRISKMEGSFLTWYFWLLYRVIGISPKFEGKKKLIIEFQNQERCRR